MKIHHLLQAGKYVNAVNLVPTLGVKERTARKDLHHMRDTLKLPMAYSYAKKGFYYTCEVTSLPTQLISEKDVHLLALLQLFLVNFEGAIKRKIERLIRDIIKTMPEGSGKAGIDWSKLVSIRYSNQSKPRPETFDILIQAAADCERVIVKHRKAGTVEVLDRTLDGLHLHNADGDWYLFARCHLRGKVQTFSLARIEGIKRTGVTFKRPADFDIDKELEKSFGIQSADGNYQIVLRLSAYAADVVREREFRGQTALINLPDGRAEWHLNLSSLVEIRRWVGRWLRDVVVVSPPELQRLTMEDAQTFLCNMKRETGL